MRYMHPMLLSARSAHDRLARICHCDYNREITLVAEYLEPETGEPCILGATRMSKLHGVNAARFSALISDPHQGRGIGKQMIVQTIHVAKEEKLEHLEALMTYDNSTMQHLLKQLGFEFSPSEDSELLRAVLIL